jgi:hypothetical protein
VASISSKRIFLNFLVSTVEIYSLLSVPRSSYIQFSVSQTVLEASYDGINKAQLSYHLNPLQTLDCLFVHDDLLKSARYERTRMEMCKQKCNGRMFPQPDAMKRMSECSKAQQGSQQRAHHSRLIRTEMGWNTVVQDASSARTSSSQCRVRIPEGQQKLFQSPVRVCRKGDYPLQDYCSL